MAKMPSSIRLGSQVWEIVEQKRKHQADPNHFGFTTAKDNTIVIDSELSPSMKRTTLFHELLHAVRITFGGSFVPGKGTAFDEWEHFFIGLYEEPVVMLFRDNPALVAFLTDES